MNQHINFCPKCGTKLRTVTHSNVSLKECDNCGWQYNTVTGNVVQLSKDGGICHFPCVCGAMLAVHDPEFQCDTSCPHCGREYVLPIKPDPAWTIGMICIDCGRESNLPANKGMVAATCPYCGKKQNVDTGTWPQPPTKIVHCPHCNGKNRVPDIQAKISATCGHCGRKFIPGKIQSETPKAQPKQNPAQARMNFADYTADILDHCSSYFKKRDDESAEYVESKLALTQTYMGTGEVSDYLVHGVLGMQHLICALYYTENYLQSKKAYEHAKESYAGQKIYLENVRNTLDAEQIRQNEVYKRQALILQAYAMIQLEDFEGVMNLFVDEPVTPLILALTGTAATRMAYEYENHDQYAYVGYALLKEMDVHVEGPFKWVYEEDVFRAAYSFLTLLVTNAHESFPGETRIPQSRTQARAYAQKIYDWVKDPQQKQWALEDLQSYL
ncbi:MAG: zf-TFIIB domain-containing protein [Clostridia bacterium]|nr:zf-TFIIB domain-containing protein [Clostridia bacterium]